MNKEYLPALVLMGEIMLSNSCNHKAKLYFEKVLNLNANNKHALTALAKITSTEGNYTQAFDYFKQIMMKKTDINICENDLT